MALIKKNKTKSKKYDATIICCLYNEVGLIDEKLFSFIKEIKKFKKKCQVIIIDNNSFDGTRAKLKNLKKKKLFRNVMFIFNNSNLGKGGSVKKACFFSNAEYICIFDIDEYFTKDLIQGIKLVKTNSLDLLIGSRIHEKNKYIYKANYYGVRFLTYLINILFGTKLTDAAGAIKIFKKKSYNKVLIESSGFDFEFELICKFAKKKFIISEFYNSYKPRTYLEGKKLKAIKDGTKILLTIIKNIF